MLDYTLLGGLSTERKAVSAGQEAGWDACPRREIIQ